MSGRLAIYFAPAPGSALAAFGAEWLGRDAADGQPRRQPRLAGIAPQRLAAITAPPRHYGFHATLKPPFTILAGQDARAVHDAAKQFAGQRRVLTLPALRLASLSGFLALVPAAASADLQALAEACVVAFDRFRAPPDAAELAKRRANGLTARQEALLARWGYPYVMEEFRFHLTLTERLAEEERAAVQAALAPLCETFCRAPLAIDGLTVFEQPNHDSAFVVSGRYPFAG